MDRHILGIFEGETGEILDRFGLCRREKERLSFLREMLNDGIQSLFKPNIETSIGLIEDCCIVGVV